MNETSKNPEYHQGIVTSILVRVRSAKLVKHDKGNFFAIKGSVASGVKADSKEENKENIKNGKTKYTAIELTVRENSKQAKVFKAHGGELKEDGSMEVDYMVGKFAINNIKTYVNPETQKPSSSLIINLVELDLLVVNNNEAYRSPAYSIPKTKKKTNGSEIEVE